MSPRFSVFAVINIGLLYQINIICYNVIMGKEQTDEIRDLIKGINKSNNLWWAMFRGIFYGFGFFIGSAILAAALIYVSSKIQGWAYIGDFVEKFIDIVSKTQS